MKRILIIFLFCSLTLAANDFDFQQVYEVPGKSSKDIETAFDELKFNVEVSKLDKFSAALDLILETKLNQKMLVK
tara:strand:+ start:246 stop:470 length:225 start_codon:yes stop_codon:yes gene_type:complete